MPNYMEKMGQYLDQMRETDGHIYQLAGLNSVIIASMLCRY